MHEPTPIGIIAAADAGVASWLGALSSPEWRKRSDGLHVHGLDGVSSDYLANAAAALSRRESSAFGEPVQQVRFHVHTDHFDADFQVVDVDRSTLDQSLHRLEAGALDPVLEHLVPSPVLWLFLDPARDLTDDSEAEQRRTALMTLLAERRRRAARRGGVLLPDVAVVLTKMDAHPKTRTPAQVEEFAAKRQPAFIAKLARHANRVRFFASSAYGDGGAPVGVAEVLEWTARAAHRRQVGPRWKKPLIAAATLGILVAGFAAWWFVETDREARVVADTNLPAMQRLKETSDRSDRVADSRQRLFRERIEALWKSLEGEPSASQVDDAVHEIAALRAARPGASDSALQELQRAANRRRESQQLAAIREASRNDCAKARTMAEAFRHTFPDSEQLAAVQQIIDQCDDSELQAARSQVKTLVAVDAAALARKADAIREFLQTYGGRVGSEERPKIERAAVLGARFAKPGRYRIHLRRSGNLLAPRNQHVKILLDGVLQREFLAPAPTTLENWDKTFDLSWQAGQSIHVMLASQSRNWVNTGYYVVAERREDDLLALRALSGLGPPQVRDAWREIFKDGVALLDTSIEGIAAEDWRIASDYLFPGDKW